MVNAKRPQTSYGGISARQKSLQKSLRQQSSKKESRGEMFPFAPSEGFDNLLNNNVNDNHVNNFDFGFKNKLSQLIQKNE
jgi:hypothetical protein